MTKDKADAIAASKVTVSKNAVVIAFNQRGWENSVEFFATKKQAEKRAAEVRQMISIDLQMS